MGSARGKQSSVYIRTTAHVCGLRVWYSSVCNMCAHTTVDEQFSTCSQQHVLHTPYTCVHMQIEYCEVLLMPGSIADCSALLLPNSLTCCTITYVLFTVMKLTVTTVYGLHTSVHVHSEGGLGFS